jgi:hypothetical protein
VFVTLTLTDEGFPPPLGAFIVTFEVETAIVVAGFTTSVTASVTGATPARLLWTGTEALYVPGANPAMLAVSDTDVGAVLPAIFAANHPEDCPAP